MSGNAREAILEAARRTAQAHGYGGLNFRDIGAEVGIKAAVYLGCGFMMIPCLRGR
jgi:TetR/AcrR family transcriptional regulator, transcriptional repressor for nem operon